VMLGVKYGVIGTKVRKALGPRELEVMENFKSEFRVDRIVHKQRNLTRLVGGEEYGKNL
jgi:hypothetical protein